MFLIQFFNSFGEKGCSKCAGMGLGLAGWLGWLAKFLTPF